MHMSELLEGWYSPAGHGVQVADPVDEAVPAGHLVHAAAPRVPLELVPASQGMQKTEAAAGWWNPAAHCDMEGMCWE